MMMITTVKTSGGILRRAGSTKISSPVKTKKRICPILVAAIKKVIAETLLRRREAAVDCRLLPRND
jgi:hypothetical protein